MNLLKSPVYGLLFSLLGWLQLCVGILCAFSLQSGVFIIGAFIVFIVSHIFSMWITWSLFAVRRTMEARNVYVWRAGLFMNILFLVYWIYIAHSWSVS